MTNATTTVRVFKMVCSANRPGCFPCDALIAAASCRGGLGAQMGWLDCAGCAVYAQGAVLLGQTTIDGVLCDVWGYDAGEVGDAVWACTAGTVLS